jgi:hypothetical protein
MSTHLSRLHREPSGTGRARRLTRRLAVLTAALALAAPAGSQAQTCPISYGSADNAKPNKLYLYFPASDDATFPNYAALVSPARAFNTSLLTSYTGTANALRNAIHTVVVDDYCEFNVQVLQTTTAPPATFARRATVAVGTDRNGTSPNVTFGQANAVDVGDATVVDFARVWAGSYQEKAGGAGGALNGANSTLTRWAASIGGTAAHEAGHLYGLSHGNGSTVKPGEDALTRHIMPQGSLLTDEQRAGYRRHFNDTEFSILASNVGLSIQTMHNWDLTNPNNVAARQLQMEFLSTQASVVLSWSYGAALSPWINPTVSSSLGTQVFKGTTYNRFRITWSTGHSWANGSPGEVPAGGDFHIGATFSGVDFNTPDPIIITRITLLDASANPLTLAPRLPGYDAGTLDASDGSFRVNFFNVDPAASTLLVTNVQVFQLPRVLSIDAMVPGAPMRTWLGEPVLPWPVRDTVSGQQGGPGLRERYEVRDVVQIPIATLAQGRHIFQNVVTRNCRPGDRSFAPEVNECVNGIFVDLFPATTVYVVATIVDPQARHWDPAQGRFVVGPVQSRLFYQFAGHHPDLNRNGMDDAIDIFRGTSKDTNRDGVPDDARPVRGWFHWWWLLLLLLLVIVAVVWWHRHRRP